MQELKLKIYTECQKRLYENMTELEIELKEIRNGFENDAKSSAGDKHETARAMMQIECERLERQLDGLKAQKSRLDRIDASLIQSVVSPGSLLKTNNGFFYMSIPMGKVILDSCTVVAISIESPLGQKMKGLRSGDQIRMNDHQYLIEDVV